MIKEVLQEAVKAGAAVLKEYFYKDFTIAHKEVMNNLVTEADIKAEQAIISVIKTNFSEHSILCEEEGSEQQNSDYKWIIDPIDGTVNFAHGVPICCVSVAVAYKDEVIIGAVYNPLMNEFFFAEKRKGAWLNEKPIKVSTKQDFNKCFLVTGFPYKYPEGDKGPLYTVDKLVRMGLPIRRLGSAALDLCWVAAGRFDCYYEHHLEPWDSAAGALIVVEAGGTVTSFTGSEFSLYHAGIAATNGLLHNQLINTINS